jgi:hypothetical protein
LNCTGGVNHRGKMAPIVAETMMVDVETAREILSRPKEHRKQSKSNLLTLYYVFNTHSVLIIKGSNAAS